MNPEEAATTMASVGYKTSSEPESHDERLKGQTMFRYLQLGLVGALCALAAFAVGVTEELPAGVQVVFVSCLALFFGALLAGTTAPMKGDRAN